MSPEDTHLHGRVLRSPEVFTSPHGQRTAPMKPTRPCCPNVCLAEGFCFTTDHCRARLPSHDTALMDGCHPKVCGVRLGGLLFHPRQLVRVVLCQVYTLQHTVGGVRCQVYGSSRRSPGSLTLRVAEATPSCCGGRSPPDTCRMVYVRPLSPDLSVRAYVIACARRQLTRP